MARYTIQVVYFCIFDPNRAVPTFLLCYSIDQRWWYGILFRSCQYKKESRIYITNTNHVLVNENSEYLIICKRHVNTLLCMIWLLYQNQCWCHLQIAYGWIILKEINSNTHCKWYEIKVILLFQCAFMLETRWKR